jgi:hypothetical protein
MCRNNLIIPFPLLVSSRTKSVRPGLELSLATRHATTNVLLHRPGCMLYRGRRRTRPRKIGWWSRKITIAPSGRGARRSSMPPPSPTPPIVPSHLTGAVGFHLAGEDAVDFSLEQPQREVANLDTGGTGWRLPGAPAGRPARARGRQAPGRHHRRGPAGSDRGTR